MNANERHQAVVRRLVSERDEALAEVDRLTAQLTEAQVTIRALVGHPEPEPREVETVDLVAVLRGAVEAARSRRKAVDGDHA